MFTERITFRAKYGQGDALVALLKEQQTREGSGAGVRGARLYTDATGPMFTVAFEMDYDDLAAYAAADQAAMYAEPAFQEWFGRMVTVTEVGERQLFNMEKLL